MLSVETTPRGLKVCEDAGATPVHFPLGVIAGTRSFNPLTHDGLTGDFRVIDQVVAFLESGNFSGDGVETFSCNQSTGK